MHAGSGRELAPVITHCHRTGATLLELSTGSALEDMSPVLAVVLCPNTNILMLKFMAMIAASGHLFRGCNVSLQESHQQGKTSTPGTAVALAASLGLKPDAIVSERDPVQQMSALGHAVHRIRIEDAGCTLSLESRVMEAAPYAHGVGQLLRALQTRQLEPGLHRVGDLVRDGWL